MAPRSPANEPTDDTPQGFPEHGDAFVDGDEPEVPVGDPPLAPQPPQPDPVADLRRENEELRREMQEVRRMPPANNPPPEPPVDEYASIDWEKELFANPGATLKKHGDMVARQVEGRLRSEYQRDQGTATFWSNFYSQHPDLKEDHDLVEVTLNKNLADLANIPVDKAYVRLAELTRDRIMRYAGSAAKPRKRPKVEGGPGPRGGQPPVTAPDEGNVTSLSELLRARRAKRRGTAA